MDKRHLWAMVEGETGEFVSDRNGVLLWSRKRDVPWSDEERVARVVVTVSEINKPKRKSEAVK